MPSLAEIRTAYPQYADMSDADLAGALHAKFYSDIPRAEFDKRMGVAPPPAKSAPEVSWGGTAIDAAKSVGVGAAKGTIGLAGLAGDAAEYGARGIDAATRFIGGKLGVDVTPRADRAPTYGSADIQKAVESKTGEFYKPQTQAGRYAQSVGEFAPGLVGGPAGLARRAVTHVIAPGLGSEAAGQATEGTAIEPFARLGGAVAGGALPSVARRMVTPVPATAERTALAATLESEGIPLTAGQRTGNRPLQWAEAAAADTPLAAGRAATMNEEQARAFTGAVLRRMGMSGDEIATPQALAAGKQNLSNQFEQLSARNTLVPDQKFVSDLTKTAQDYVSTVIPSQRAAGRQNVETIMRDVVDVMQQNGGQMPGQLYQATRSRLSTMADGIAQNDPQLAKAIKGIRNSLDDAMERSIGPQDAAQWKKVREQWGNWKQIEKAATGAGAQTAEGFISPSQLRNAVASNNRGAYATGQSSMAGLARAGEALLRPLPQSGTAPRQAANNLFASMGGAGAGAMLGAPAGPVGMTLGGLAGAAGPALVARLLLAKPVQAYLGNQAVRGSGNATQKALANALLSYVQNAHP